MGIFRSGVVYCCALATFFCFSFASAGSPETAARNGVLILELPRAAGAGEAIYLRLTVGVLPRGARLVVRLGDGEIAGTVATYGVRPNQKAGIHTIGIPARAVVDGKVSLVLDVEEKKAPVRPPTQSEVEGATLVFRPVT
jgi:hypothetical protein